MNCMNAAIFLLAAPTLLAVGCSSYCPNDPAKFTGTFSGQLNPGNYLDGATTRFIESTNHKVEVTTDRVIHTYTLEGKSYRVVYRPPLGGKIGLAQREESGVVRRVLASAGVSVSGEAPTFRLADLRGTRCQ